MTTSRIALVAFLLVALTACGDDAPSAGDDVDTQPNILLIVADDLGYSDIGSFGGEVRTPVLDRLASEGLRFSGFHVLPTCSPTRACLMSGNDNHVAGMGVMGEFIYPEIADLPGYAGHLVEQVATLPELLKQGGYRTYMAGKWHLGEEDEHSPYAHGFERTFAMMNGGGSHWADRRPLSPTQKMIYRRDGERVEALPEDFYSTKNYTDALVEFIGEGKDDGQPFFAYLAYTAPHDPLHAPAEYIAKYKGRFDDGWDALAARRLARLEELGLIPESVTEFPENFMTKKWSTLSDDERRTLARDMEVYAAMIEYMDTSIGRLFEYLEAEGLYDNTLILFFSDNGANGAHATAYPGNADGKYLASFDNSLENRGLPNSFIDMGPGWAQASSAPLRLFKSFTTQGGIRAPLIVKSAGEMGRGGEWNHAFLHVTDILPTLLDVAGVEYPETIGERTVRPPIGRSMMPVLRGEADQVRTGEGVGYELFEMKAYIQDEWKLLRLPEPFGTGDWQLFNLKTDPGEIRDVSADHPEKKVSLIEAWKAYAEQNDVFDHKGRFDALYRKAYGSR